MSALVAEEIWSLSKMAKSNKLCLFLRECAFFTDGKYIEDKIDSDTYQNIVLYSPTNTSHLGMKFKDYGISSSRAITDFMKKLLEALEVEYYFFETYNSGKDSVSCKFQIENLYDDRNWLIVNSANGLAEGTYCGLRNALAHGNVVKYNNFYYLYSVSSRNNSSHTDSEKPISFLLKIDSLEKLDEFMNILIPFKARKLNCS